MLIAKKTESPYWRHAYMYSHFSPSAAHADIVTTLDGARLVGTINKITPKTVELKTAMQAYSRSRMDQIAFAQHRCALDDATHRLDDRHRRHGAR
jgi:hypothetical protein